MGKHTDRLDKIITKNHYTGSAESGKPSDLLIATAEMSHAKYLANGNSETRLPSAELNRLVSNNNKPIKLDLLRDKSNSL